MRKLLLFALLLNCFSLFGCSEKSDDPASPVLPDEEVIFFDDFTSFNSLAWTKETREAGWTNRELQSYHPSQVTIGKDDGRSVLTLTARRQDGKIVSGRVNSKGKVAFKYGRVEACIKLPATDAGLWPAFWMMGNIDAEWPACGEIDIMEMGDAVGILSATTDLRVNSAIHFGPDPARHEQLYFADNAPHSLQDGKYHIYAAEWTDKSIAISIDGIPFTSFEIADNSYFHHNFFLLFNLAVGGDFSKIYNVADITALPEGGKVAMYVDWVKIVKLK